jgi:hypothetical protein
MCCFPMKSHPFGVLVASVSFDHCHIASRVSTNTSSYTCIQTHPRLPRNSSFHLKQEWSQSDGGAVNGWLLSAKRDYFLTPSHPLLFYALFSPSQKITTQVRWYFLQGLCQMYVIHGVNTRFWPNVRMMHVRLRVGFLHMTKYNLNAHGSRSHLLRVRVLGWGLGLE